MTRSSEPAYTPRAEFECDGPTHYQGCKCHEARRNSELEALRAERETWGNEYAAVCMVKDQLRESEAQCARYRGALEEIIFISMKGGGDWESVARAALTPPSPKTGRDEG